MSLCSNYRAGLDDTTARPSPAPSASRPAPISLVGAVELVARAPKPWPLYILVGLAMIYSGKAVLGPL